MRHVGPIVLLAVLSAAAEVTPPPEALVREWKLSPFYRKHLDAGGIPILASAKVSDFALAEAAWIINRMLEGRDDLRAAIVKGRVRLAVMAPDEFTTDVPEHSDLSPARYWNKRARGLGATPIRPAVSCGEENLLGYRGDPYAAENVLIHEFAHVIHEIGLSALDPGFDKRLDQTYREAVAAGLWKGTYAGTNRNEYWAEGVQSWFDTNRENDHDHNEVDTREELKKYDPALAALIAAELGDRPWRYQRPADRGPDERRHLDGFDLAAAPTFVWPKELLAAEISEAPKPVGDSTTLVQLVRSAPTASAVSQQSKEESAILFVNRRRSPVSIHWIDFDGRKQKYGELAGGAERRQHTFAGHSWVVTDESGKPLGSFTAQSVEGRAVIE
jgi:hypothetical protein